MSSYRAIIMSSYYRETKWLKSLSVPSQGLRHKLRRLPLCQGRLLQNKRATGNNFLRGIWQWRSRTHSSSETHLFEKNRPPKIFWNKFFQRQKKKSCKLPETRFAKVLRRSNLWSKGKRPLEVSKLFRNSWSRLSRQTTNQRTNQPGVQSHAKNAYEILVWFLAESLICLSWSFLVGSSTVCGARLCPL